MKSLVYLAFLKIKGAVRFQFKKISSVIFISGIVVLYGGILFAAVVFKGSIEKETTFLPNYLVLTAIGSSFFITMLTLFANKNKAILRQNDAHYLFAGPYSRGQVMKSISLTTFFTSIGMSVISLYMIILFGGGWFSTAFIIIIWLLSILICFIGAMFVDYLYVLKISNPKYSFCSQIAGFLICAGILFIAFVCTIGQDGTISQRMIDFVLSPEFGYIPVYGWMSYAAMSFYEGNYIGFILGTAGNLVVIGVLYYFFVNFKQSFYEVAMDDSIRVTEILAQARAGKFDPNSNAKVKNRSVAYRTGAGAIFSKGMLELKKTNGFLSLKDFGLLAFYLLISKISSGEAMFIYFVVLWVITDIRSTPLGKELLLPYIYLIPADPFKKLIAIFLPTVLRVFVISTFACIGAFIVFQLELSYFIQILLVVYSYALLFVSGMVLATRMLGIRSNKIIESLLTMLIIFVCAIPGSVLLIVLGVIMPSVQLFSVVAPIVSSIVNGLLSIAIIYGCRNMLKGREISSD